MTTSLSSRWEAFAAAQLQSGQSGPAREVVGAGLSLIAKLAALRATIAAALAEGGERGVGNVRAAVAAKADELRAKAS